MKKILEVNPVEISSMEDGIELRKTHSYNQRISFNCSVCGKTIEKRLVKLDRGLLCEVCLLKKTCLDRYGVENPSQVKIFKDKRESTMLKKYGKSNAMYVPELMRKQKRKYIFEDIGFDSSWELAYYI